MAELGFRSSLAHGYHALQHAFSSLMSGFLNLSTADMEGYIILCWQALPCTLQDVYQRQQPLPGDASSNASSHCAHQYVTYLHLHVLSKLPGGRGIGTPKPSPVDKNGSQVYEEAGGIPVAHQGHLANGSAHSPVGCAGAEEKNRGFRLRWV